MTMPAKAETSAAMLEKVVIEGDLSLVSAVDKVAYYKAVCESLGVNPLTKPFSYIKLNGKLVLYANRDCTDQLRKNHSITIAISRQEVLNDIYIVNAQATTPEGRSDESTGAVSIKGLAGDALANAYMKCETKAKRRVTLSIVGLGWLDETEVTTIPNAQVVDVDGITGEIKPPARPTVEHYCQEHRQEHQLIKSARTGISNWAHQVAKSGRWCVEKAEAAADTPPRTEDPLGPGGPIADLQDAVVAAGYDWDTWQNDILQMPVGEYLTLGKTLENAYNLLRVDHDND